MAMRQDRRFAPARPATERAAWPPVDGRVG